MKKSKKKKKKKKMDPGPFEKSDSLLLTNSRMLIFNMTIVF